MDDLPMLLYRSCLMSLITLFSLFSSNLVQANTYFNQQDLESLSQQVHQRHKFSIYPHAKALSDSSKHEHAKAVLQTLYDTKRHLFFEFLAQQLTHTEAKYHPLLLNSVYQLFALNGEQIAFFTPLIEAKNSHAIKDALKYQIRHSQHPTWEKIQHSFLASLLAQGVVTNAKDCIDLEPPVSNTPKDVRRSHLNCMARSLDLQVIDIDINESKVFSITELSGVLGDNEKDQQILTIDAQPYLAKAIEQYQQTAQAERDPNTIPTIILVSSSPSQGYLAPTVTKKISGRDAYEQYQLNQRLARLQKEQNESPTIKMTMSQKQSIALSKPREPSLTKQVLTSPITWLVLSAVLSVGVTEGMLHIPGNPFLPKS